jgi:hypothetical protein
MSERVLVWMVIETFGTVLLARRKPDQPPFAGAWTLPGDDMRADESASETMERVLRDQLDATLSGDTFESTLNLTDGGVEYVANLFRVRLQGHPRYRESGPYAEVAWADPKALEGIQMPEPLRAALGKLGDGSKT